MSFKTILLFSCLAFSLSFAGPSVERSLQHDTLGTLMVGMSMPDFAQVDLSQSHMEIMGLEDMMLLVKRNQGHPVLAFFSTSCIPCRVGLQMLRDNEAMLKQAGVVVWLIALGDERNTVRKFINVMHLNFPVIHDMEGKIAARYGVMGKGADIKDAKLPLTVVGDAQGKVRKFISIEGKDYLKLIQELGK